MNRRQTLLAFTAAGLAGLPLKALADDALKAAINGAHRSPKEKARDPYRRPEAALTFSSDTLSVANDAKTFSCLLAVSSFGLDATK